MAPYLHQFSVVGQKVHLYGDNRDTFALYLASYLKNYAETLPSNGVIWNEFSEQRQHQSIRRASY